eukprot:15334759-Ditylum_brightwellii.AAC.1
MKAEYAGVKKKIEEGIAYGDDKEDLDNNMVITCVYPGCPRKKKHKIAASKEYMRHNKLTCIKHKDVPHELKNLAHSHLPVYLMRLSAVDEIMWRRGSDDGH